MDVYKIYTYKIIQIIERFDKWLEETAIEQNMTKVQLQELIKNVLNGGV